MNGGGSGGRVHFTYLLSLPLIQCLVLFQCHLSPPPQEGELKGHLRSSGAVLRKWVGWWQAGEVWDGKE